MGERQQENIPSILSATSTTSAAQPLVPRQVGEFSTASSSTATCMNTTSGTPHQLSSLFLGNHITGEKNHVHVSTTSSLASSTLIAESPKRKKNTAGFGFWTVTAVKMAIVRSRPDWAKKTKHLLIHWYLIVWEHINPFIIYLLNKIPDIFNIFIYFFTVLCRAPSFHWSILNNEIHLSGSRLYGMVFVNGMADSCLYNKQNNSRTLGDMEFIFSCSHSISHSFAVLTRSFSIYSTRRCSFVVRGKPRSVISPYGKSNNSFSIEVCRGATKVYYTAVQCWRDDKA